MANAQMTSFGIAGIGHSLPSKVLSNKELEKMVDTSDEWIQTRTGIRERRIANDGVGTSRLAADSARMALDHAKMRPEEIELIIVGTTTPDTPLPSCACLVQKQIGATHAACFDLAAACAGFVYALATAHQFLKAGMYRNVLVIGADKISSFIDWKDRSTCILFGDAAGACVLKAVEGRGIISSDLGSDGNFNQLITIPAGGSRSPATHQTVDEKGHCLKMNGAEVFKFAVRSMVSSIENILTQTGISADELKCIIPHQANMRIVDAVTSRLKVGKDKVFVNLSKYGNTSAASTIVGLSEAVNEGRINKGDLVLLSTFGAGLVWGATILEWSL